LTVSEHEKRKRFSIVFVSLCLMCFGSGLRARAQGQDIPLRRVEVIRVRQEDVGRLPQSLRSIFTDPVPDGEPVASLDEATKRAGFSPRLLRSQKVEQFVVIDPVNAEAKVNVGELTAALGEAKADNITVPPMWNNAVIGLRQGRGILTDYGDFFIAQAPSMTLSTPAGLALPEFFEVVFRILGLSAADARTLRDRFAETPSTVFPIPPRYEMDIHDVTLMSGRGLLMQNAEKIGELALMWNAGDRSFFLSGLLTEQQAIAIANGLE
jgi:hypothetical protein